MKSLGKLEGLPLRHAAGALAQPLDKLCKSPVHHLAPVTCQRLHFGIKRTGDINMVVRVITAPEKHLPHLVRLESLRHEVGVGKMVAGVRKDSIESDLTGNAVVPVPDIAPVRVGCNDSLRPVEPNHADKLFAELRGIFQTLVRVAQKPDIAHPQHRRCRKLLLLTRESQLLRRYRGVAGTLISVSADNVHNPFPFAGPVGDRSRHAELSIIRVRCNNHGMYFPSHRFYNPPQYEVMAQPAPHELYTIACDCYNGFVGISGAGGSYIVRSYRVGDFERYVRLMTDAEAVEPTGYTITSQTLRERLARPGYNPERDLFFVEAGQRLAGYLSMVIEIPIRRAVLDCWVRPEERRKGLATKLLCYAMARASEAGAAAVNISVAEESATVRSILLRRGFRHMRTFLELRLDMGGSSGQVFGQPVPGSRHLRPGEEAALAQLQNRAFTGNWGFCPNSTEEIRYRLNLSDSSPGDVLVIGGDGEISGYCWTWLLPPAAGTDWPRGRVLMLGVDPDCKGKGIGLKALAAGLACLKERGACCAELTVDSENAIAFNLYQSIGFTVRRKTLWYERMVNPPPPARAQPGAVGTGQ